MLEKCIRMLSRKNFLQSGFEWYPSRSALLKNSSIWSASMRYRNWENSSSGKLLAAMRKQMLLNVAGDMHLKIVSQKVTASGVLS